MKPEKENLRNQNSKLKTRDSGPRTQDSGLTTQDAQLSTAVILAAGAGTRLGDLGRRYSKPMVPIAGRPLIDWVIERLRAAGVERLVVVGHAGDTALTSFLATAHSDATLVTQAERRGIADALRLALPQLATESGYLACACDSLFEPDDIARLLTAGQTKDIAVVGILEMGFAATGSRSAVRLDGDRVVEIVEKPKLTTAASSLVAMPLYWIPRIAATCIEHVAPLGAEQYISTALNAFIHAGGTVLAVRVRGRLEITSAGDVACAERVLG